MAKNKLEILEGLVKFLRDNGAKNFSYSEKHYGYEETPCGGWWGPSTTMVKKEIPLSIKSISFDCDNGETITITAEDFLNYVNLLEK
ncbi:MAG: hypothetical protein KBT36_17290 [Kurthia sp.]|nr:hypothetical protein [Candidatus Kurthia equi]